MRSTSSLGVRVVRRYYLQLIFIAGFACLISFLSLKLALVHSQQWTIGQVEKQNSPVENLLLTSKIVTATSGHLFSGKPIRQFPKDKVLFANVASFPLKEAMKPIHECKFWSVVTTIFEPSDAVQAQANLGRDWCIVVVGDKKSTRSYPLTGSSHVVYLDIDQQLKITEQFSSFIHFLPWNHFGRKNIGFLYAIKQGAQAIWDFDDDNILKPSQKIIVPDDAASVQFDIPAKHSFPTYNPYIKLGAPHLPAWPRGLPLEHIKRNESHASPLKRVELRGDRIGLIQSLADHDPDTDAIYRLIMPLPFNFSPPAQVKSILLPDRTLAPLNAQACLFKRSAFFMLLLPITVHGRVSDIWRGYAGQRLLWDLDLHIAFAAPLVDQFRNPHNYLGDLDAEIPLYKQSGVLVDYLQHEWKGTAATLPGLMEELYISLYEQGYFEIDDVILMQHWIQALLDIGYTFPTIVNNRTLHTQVILPPSKQEWPDLELFCPIPPIDSEFKAYSTWLHPSMEFFWPKEHLNIVFVTDGEAANSKEFSEKLLKLVNPISNRTRIEFNLPLFAANILGHDRQQWLMMWADNFTSAEYVGFLDTDTVFSTRVTLDDLFEDGKPRALVFYGEPGNYYYAFWQAVPRATYGATGLKEKLRAMAYFPVVVKRSHLKIIRDHIRKHMDKPTFDLAFQTIVNRFKYSQFNFMMNVLYYLHHDEYTWHITERHIGWTGPVPEGQIESLQAAAFPPKDLIAYPRIAVHWDHERFSHLKGLRAQWKFNEIMRYGYCNSLSSLETVPSQCESLKLDANVNPYEWMFDTDNFAPRPESIEAHKKRRKAVLALPKHPWNRSLVAKYLTASPGWAQLLFWLN